MRRGMLGTRWGCVGPVTMIGVVIAVWAIAGGAELGMVWFFIFVAIGFAVDALVSVVLKALGCPRNFGP